MLRESFPAELGLTNLGYAILEALANGVALDSLLLEPAEMIDELARLEEAKLIALPATNGVSERLPAPDCVMITPAGRHLVTTLLREGEFVVFFQAAIEWDGESTSHPIICRVIEDVPLGGEWAKIAYTSKVVNKVGKAVCADYTRGTVSTNLLWRLGDYLDYQPVCHADDVPYFRDHDLGKIVGFEV